jgi:hypothetical protein
MIRQEGPDLVVKGRIGRHPGLVKLLPIMGEKRRPLELEEITRVSRFALVRVRK